MVVDDFRHLDTSIVLALVRSRADFGGKGSKDAHHWSRILRYATQTCSFPVIILIVFVSVQHS